MGLTRRARLTARFIPLLVVVLVAGAWFSAALSFADPKGKGNSAKASDKSKDAPGQQKKAEGTKSSGGSGGSERAGGGGSGGSGGSGGGGSSQANGAGGSGGGNGGGGSSSSAGGGNGGGGNSGGASNRSGGGDASTQSNHGGGGDPPGNNGTVKVDAREFDDHPNNEPHVGCIFQIDFYGYDEGDLEATYNFALKPPTTSPSGDDDLDSGSVFIGGDAAGGGTDLDGSVTVDLSSALEESGATPHPKQGFHVKLTVHAEGSQGSDVKHKVFWVQECAQQASSPPPTSEAPASSEGVLPSQIESVPPSSEAPPPSEVLPSQQIFSPGPSASVLPRRVTQPESVSVLPFTGGDLVALMLGAGGLLAAGGGLLALRRRR